MPTSPAFGLLADLDLYEDTMRAAAEAWPDAAFVRETAALVHGMHARASAVPQLGATWLRFYESHAGTVQAFSRADSLAQRLDALEQHIAAVLDLQRDCLALMGGRAAD